MGAWDLVPSKYVPRGDEGSGDDLDDPMSALFSETSGHDEELVPATVLIESVLLRDLRKRDQMMQADVAERMGVKQPTVARIEKEHHVPERLAAYLAALGYRLELVAVREGERVRIG